MILVAQKCVGKQSVSEPNDIHFHNFSLSPWRQEGEHQVIEDIRRPSAQVKMNK
jgi:hypothetical protein